MIKTAKTKERRSHKTGSAADKTDAPQAKVEHVPEAAENFEHTIRRLVIQKELERSKSFGLYR